MQLDLATVLVLHPLSLIMGSACFLYAMRHSRHHRGLGKMAIAFIFLSIGSVLAAMGERQALPYKFWTLTSFVLGPVAYCLFWIGLRNLVHERRMPHSAWVFLIPAVLLLIALVTDFHLSNFQRAAAFLVTMAGFALAGAWLVLSDPLEEKLSSRYALSAILGTKALVAVTALCSIAFPGLLGMTPAITFCGLILCQFGIAMFVLIFVQERVESRLVKLTETDTLTGIHNRYWLHDQMPYVASPGDAYIVIDIDFFKRVNDVHGHAAGDKVLVAAAQKMASILEPDAMFARQGGEEFGLFVAAGGIQTPFTLAEVLRQGVETLVVEHHGERIPVAISAGVAIADAPLAVNLLMARADNALYAAKRQGRNRVMLYSEIMDGDATGKDEAISPLIRLQA